MQKLYIFLISLLCSYSVYGQGCNGGVITLPYSEGFENGFGCWTSYDLDNNQYEETLPFHISNGNYYGIPFAKTGSYGCVAGVRLVGTNWRKSNTVMQTALVSSQITFPAGATARISFWSRSDHQLNKVSVLVMTRNTNIQSDILSGTNCTSVWGPRDFHYVSGLLDQEWEFVELDLSQFAGQSVYIAFFYNGDTDNDHSVWTVDDVNIWTLSADDAGVTEIVSPSTGIDLTNEQVVVKVKNFGTQPISNIPVTLKLNGTPVVADIITATIASEQEYLHTFSQSIDISAAATYTIEAFTALDGDANSDNNGATKQVRNYGHFEITEFPHTEDFEDDETLVFWKQQVEEQGANPLYWIYEKGSKDPRFYTVPNAHSGERNALYTGFYLPFMQADMRHRTKLVSPRIRLNSLAAPQLAFWHAQPSDDGNLFPIDTLKVYYKTSENGEWNLLYNETRILRQWTETTLALPDRSDDYYLAFEGILNRGLDIVLDDITIKNRPSIDARMVEIVAPKTGLDMANENVVVKIQNFGTVPLTVIPVAFSVNGNVVDYEIIYGSLAPLADTVYTFNTQANLAAEGQYVIKAFITRLDADGNHANDTASIIINNYVGKAVMGVAESVTTCNTVFYDNGVDGDYKRAIFIEGYTETMTFYPAAEGKSIRASFPSYGIFPATEFMGVMDDGDTLFIYSGATADRSNLLGALTGNVIFDTPEVFQSTSEDGALTFVFQKLAAGNDVASGWAAGISCADPAGIGSNGADDLNIVIYPNPSDGSRVNIGNVPPNAQISILDLSGRTLQTLENQSGTVQIKTNLQQGIYLIKINKTVRKLVVE